MKTPFLSRIRHRRHRLRDPFTRASEGDLDIIKPPSYDSSDALRAQFTAEVDRQIAEIGTSAIDPYTGGLLDNAINARTQQLIAQLDASRDEQQAVSDALLGLAREEVARRQAAYQSDRFRLDVAFTTFRVTYKELTGEEWPEKTLGQMDVGGTQSGLKPIDLQSDWSSHLDLAKPLIQPDWADGSLNGKSLHPVQGNTDSPGGAE